MARLLLLATLIQLYVSFALASSVSCRVLFLNPTNTIEHYSKPVKELAEQRERGGFHPAYISAKADAAKASNYKGTREGLPKLILDGLHKNLSLLSFQLRGAEESALKAQNPGSFLSLRWSHRWEGKDRDTNIGIPVQVLFDRAAKLKKSEFLVDSTARAVMFIDHGSGTTTTGHHVFTAISNHLIKYGVVVISMDGPGHGYNVTEGVSKDSIEYRAHFAKTFVHPEVAVLNGGHSGGALFTDIIMRLAANPKSAIHGVFDALILMSTPLDSSRGGNLTERLRADEQARSTKEFAEGVPREEQDIEMDLLRAGKSGPRPMHETLKLERRQKYIKTDKVGPEALSVMGNRDGLYFPHKELYREFISSLPNMTDYLMGDRMRLKGEIKPTSHLIFDNQVFFRKNPENIDKFPLGYDVVTDAATFSWYEPGMKLSRIESHARKEGYELQQEVFFITRAFIEQTLRRLGKLESGDYLDTANESLRTALAQNSKNQPRKSGGDKRSGVAEVNSNSTIANLTAQVPYRIWTQGKAADLMRIYKVYVNDLAFRSFAHSYSHNNYVVTAAGKSIETVAREKAAELEVEFNELQAKSVELRKAQKKDPSVKDELSQITDQLRAMSGKIKQLRQQSDMTKLSWLGKLTDSVAMEKAQENLNQRAETRSQKENLRRELNTLKNELRKARAKDLSVMGAFLRNVKDYATILQNNQGAYANVVGARGQVKLVEAENKLFEQYNSWYKAEISRQKNDELREVLVARNAKFEEIASLQAKDRTLEAEVIVQAELLRVRTEDYQTAKTESEPELRERVMSGKAEADLKMAAKDLQAGGKTKQADELLEIAEKIQTSGEKYFGIKDQEGSLDTVNRLIEEVKAKDAVLRQYEREITLLELEYAQNYAVNEAGEPLLIIYRVKLAELLETSVEEMSQTDHNVILDIWKKWTEIWEEGSEVKGTSTY